MANGYHHSLYMDYKHKNDIEHLIKEHGATLIRFLSQRLKSREDAEDVAQSTFMRLYTLDNPSEVENPRAFLFQVAANLSVDQLRRKNLMGNFIDSELAKREGDDSVAIDGDISPEQVVEAKERVQRIFQVIDAMPTNVKQAFLLNRFKGLSYSEIAKLMDVSVSSVEKYMLDALKQCRRAMVEGDAGND